jgi:hypothetical protein
LGTEQPTLHGSEWYVHIRPFHFCEDKFAQTTTRLYIPENGILQVKIILNILFSLIYASTERDGDECFSYLQPWYDSKPKTAMMSVVHIRLMRNRK